VGRRGLLALALAMSLACGGGISSQELPTEPFAFVRQEASKGISNLDEFMSAVDMNVGLPPGEVTRRRAGRIARTTVMLMEPTTRTIRPVPDAGLGALPLDWSDDGLFLLIGRSVRGSTGYQLFSWNRLTGAYDRLSPDQSQGGAALGPGPIRLASIGRVMSANQQHLALFLTIDSEGTHPLPGGIDGFEPDVTPDGLSVVFVKFGERDRREGTIMISSLGEQQARPLARGRNPRLSRDGRWIVYASWRKGDSDIWIMRTDGSGRRPIATTSYEEFSPAVSPDGRYVVYASARGEVEESQVYVTRVQDRRETQLTKHGQNGRPVW
jgi:hypothetical protein